MKQIWIILGLLITTSNCRNDSNKQSFEDSLSFKTTFIGYIIGISEKPGYSYLLINADLVNNTNKPYEFVAYNCVTAANLVTEPSFIKPLTYECSRNYMLVINLKPKQELSMPIILECPDNSRSLGSTLKIGFIIINPDDLDARSDFYSILTDYRLNRTNVLWSDPIHLASGNGEAFEIRNTCDSIIN